MADAYDSYTQTTASRQLGASDFEMALRKSHENDSDPFANFSYHPPKPSGPFRQFGRRSKYRAIAMSQSRDKLAGSNSNLSASLSGSSQNLLDPTKMMNMQDDARSRRISSEVMKHRLYESVITSPRRRRFSMRHDYYGSGSSGGDGASYARMVQSVPVTPAHSETVTPVHSPTSEKKFMFGFFSRGTTPRGTTPDDEMARSMEISEEDNCKGLASLFRPQPRCIPAHEPTLMENGMEVDEDMENGRDTLENRLRPFTTPYGLSDTSHLHHQSLQQQQQQQPQQQQQLQQRPDDVFLQPLPRTRPPPRRRSPPSPLTTDQDMRPSGF